LVDNLAVSQAEVDLANAESAYHNTIRLRELAENQIAVLVGAIPSEFALPHSPLENPPPSIPAGIPSTVMLQRPDIAEAERTMASEHALIGVAYASFFPSITLTGALGFLSPDTSHFLKWISRYWAIGANASQMVFDGGRDCAEVNLAWARFHEASADYQQKVLIAFQEVENALNNIQQQGKQSQALLQAAQAAKKAFQTSMNRYIKGATFYLEVIESERAELQAEINWQDVLGKQYVSTIQLIKALGGSWESPCPCPCLKLQDCSTIE
jgi:multidrug efflux system outer membrane protein